MSVERAEEALSGVESLPSSPPPPAVSLPLFPCSSSSSRQVSAHLFSSLQLRRGQGVRPPGSRQVSFKLTSPLDTMTTPALLSDRLTHSQEVTLGLDACSISDVMISEGEEAESETGPLTEEMDLNPSGRRHIEEMECVRNHLQTMLSTTPKSTDTHDLPPAFHHLQESTYQSEATSQLLSGVEELFPRYSRLHTDVDFTHFHSESEMQLMRERLERERDRRKHSEQQLLSLQSRTLGLQQQLALAVSSDRKKDIMIEQLDKTLEKVVEGWRQHEREKSEGVRRLQEEKEAVERLQEKQKEALDGLERSLSETAETLDKEEKRNEGLNTINKQLEQDIAKLHVRVEELQKEAGFMRGEAEQQKAEIKSLQLKCNSLESELQRSTDTHTHLQQNITHLTQQLHTHRESEQREAQEQREVQDQLRQLQQELEETRRERDTVRAERALDQAQFDVQRSQCEQQVALRIACIQEENANAMAKLREHHRKQLKDLSAHHEAELSVQMDQFRVQLQEREQRHHQLTLDFNKKIAELQKELISVKTSKRKLEAEREALAPRLRGIMRSHWAEALRLLTNQNQNEELLSPSLWNGSRLQSAQVPDSISTAPSHTPDAPQAVGLHLSRDRDVRGPGDSRLEARRSECDFSLLNHSHTFSPLEPLLDDTHLTAGGVSDVPEVWDGPFVRAALEKVERGYCKTDGETGTEIYSAVKENLTLNSTPNLTHFHTRRPYGDVNQLRNQTDSETIKEMNPNATMNQMMSQNPISTLNLMPHLHHKQNGLESRDPTFMETYKSKVENDPPMSDQPVSIKEIAPPTGTISSVIEERQSELQFYISKLLACSPGAPLAEGLDQMKGRVEPPLADQRSQTEPSVLQLADLLHLTSPSTHTPQQLQQVLHTLLRSGGEIRTDQDQKLTHDKREQRTAASRSSHSATTRGRRTAPQGQKSGWKSSAWR